MEEETQEGESVQAWGKLPEALLPGSVFLL